MQSDCATQAPDGADELPTLFVPPEGAHQFELIAVCADIAKVPYLWVSPERVMMSCCPNAQHAFGYRVLNPPKSAVEAALEFYGEEVLGWTVCECAGRLIE